MGVDLVKLIKVSLTREIVHKAASCVGESEAATEKAMNAVLLTLVAAMATEVATTSGAQQLARSLDAGGYDEGVLKDLDSLFSGSEATWKAINDGRGVLNALLGAKTIGLAHLIARDTNIRPDAASSLMALLAPFVMHTLDRQRATAAPSPAGLTMLLSQQKSAVSNRLPIGIAPFLAWSGYESPWEQEVSGTKAKGFGLSWLFVVFILSALLVIGLGWLLSVLPTPDSEAAPARSSGLYLRGAITSGAPTPDRFDEAH
jgi:hypothetical protein